MLRGLCGVDSADETMVTQDIETAHSAGLDEFCEKNAHLASDATVQRKRQTQRWLFWAEALWEDPDRFDAIVRSGRYSQLRHVVEGLSDADNRAWRRLKDEVLAVRAREFLCEADAA